MRRAWQSSGETSSRYPTRRPSRSSGRSGRWPMGYSDEAEDLVLGKAVTIGEGARIAGGKIVLGDGVVVGRRGDIEVTDRLGVGRGSLVPGGAVLPGGR